MKKIEIKTKGMVCGGCENRVKNAISEIEGIEKVNADHKTGLVEIEAKDEVQVEEIEEKIEDIGFEIVK